MLGQGLGISLGLVVQLRSEIIIDLGEDYGYELCFD